MLVLAFLQINITYIALLIRFCFVFNAPPYDTPLFESNPSKPSKILKMTPHQNGRPQPPSQVKNDKTLKQKQRWHPRGQKWQPEVDIFSLKLHWLDKFAQQGGGGGGRGSLQNKAFRYSDVLCETEAWNRRGPSRHQTSVMSVLVA